MIVSDALAGPFDLVALFADEDAKRFIERIIERGQARGCLRSLRIYSFRHAARDSFVHDPVPALIPFLRPDGRYLLSWDHAGSGFHRGPAAAEAHVIQLLVQAGASRDRICAIAFLPEVEAALVPAWTRMKKTLAEARQRPEPTDEEILRRARREGMADIPWEVALAQYPKELFGALVHLLNLRASAAVFDDLGKALSLRGLKEAGPDGNPSPTSRIAEQLQRWFPLE